MAPLSREHLVEGFISEVQGYIPLISKDLAELKENSAGQQDLDRIFRLFHNIKGASAQLSLAYMSGAARLAEDLLEERIIDGKALDQNAILFIEQIAESILEIANRDIKDEQAGKKLLTEIVIGFRNLEGNHTATDHESLQNDVEMLRNGNSIMKREEVETPEICLARSFEIVNLVRSSARQGTDTVQTFTLLNELSGQVLSLADMSDPVEDTNLSVFSNELCDFIFWLQGESTTLSNQIIDLLEDYFNFLELLASCNGQVEPKKIERVVETMTQVRQLSAPSSWIKENENPIAIQEDEDFDVFLESPDFLVADDDIFSDNLIDPDHDLTNILDDESEEEFETVADISDDDADLHDIFLAECEEHLHVIGRSLIALEQQVDEPTPLTGSVEQNLADMRRAIHTLKGAAGMTGFMKLSTFAHNSEDLLDAIFDAADQVDPAEIGVLSDSIDMIERMSVNPDDVDEVRVSQIDGMIREALAIRSGRHEGDKNGVEPENVEEVAQQPEELTNWDEPVETQAYGPRTADAPVEVTDQAAGDTTILPADTSNVRVRLDHLDELVSMEGELIVARSTMERGLDTLVQTVGELNLTKDKLRKISQELETGFEVESLYGFGKESNEHNGQGKSFQPSSEFADFDPIELDRYSQLSLIIRSLNEITVDVGSIHAEMTGVTSELRGHMARQQQMMGVMQDRLMHIRMTPMSSISRGFFRAVRGAAEELKKHVRLLIEGDDIFLDRFIWTRIADPIMHILRNAVDHGIELPTMRRSAEKPEQATILIEATQQGSQVVLKISDDGHGIELDTIRRKLQEKGLVQDPSKLSDDALLDYLFIPGFTTRDEVSRISGRGVGLDVVRKHIQELRGSVRVNTTVGKGTTFELRIPTTLSLNRAVIVVISNERYAIPFYDIIEIRKVPVTDVIKGEQLTVKVSDQIMILNDLAATLGLREGTTESVLESGEITLLVVPGERDNVALLIDEIIEQQEIIVKDLGSHLKHVNGISGATIMGDGSLLPILNTVELVASERTVTVKKRVTPRAVDNNKPIRVMVVDDSVSVRQSVSRLVKSKGWEPGLATDGIDATEKIAEFKPDIIILDIEMPRMNGFELMGFLKGNERYRNIPVIMLTSRVSEKHQKKAEELGVNHYMFKPYQEGEFVSLIRSSTTGRM